MASIICEIAQQILVRRCSCSSGDLSKKTSTTMEYGVVAAEIGLAIITIVDRLGTMLTQ